MTDKIDSLPLRELKHSIKVHVSIMAGPSQQLCALLVKLVDWIDDEDKQRREKEMLDLAFFIVEAAGIYIQQSIDVRAAKAMRDGNAMPESIRTKGDDILILIGQSKKLDDRIAAKHAILRGIAEALKALGSFTKVTYLPITDSDGNVL